MSIWKQWIPKEENYYLMTAISTHIDGNSLVLAYIDRDESKRIWIRFESGFLFMRTTEEGSFEIASEKVQIIKADLELEKRKNWPLFIVSDSQLVYDFKKDYRITNKEPIGHYIIISYDDITEILSSSPPKVLSEDL